MTDGALRQRIGSLVATGPGPTYSAQQLRELRTSFQQAAKSDRTLTGPRLELKRVVVPFAVKTESISESERTFEGLLSVWGLDLGDDVMHRGAFTDTLAEWKRSGDAMPLLNSHNHYDVLSVIGQLLEGKETSEGLWTKWEVIPGDDGDRVLTRLRPSARNGRAPLSKMSIGYEAVKFDMEDNARARGGMVRNLRKVTLKEGSLVIFPMAPGARINASTVKELGASELSRVSARVDAAIRRANGPAMSLGDHALLDDRISRLLMRQGD
jgi:HK97 family phage prohead protease